MTALLAALLAATLSSSKIDDFFTIAIPLPTSVASENTPGSTPDWYVPEYTNRIDVIDSWRVEADRQTTMTNASIPFLESYGVHSKVFYTADASWEAFSVLHPDWLAQSQTTDFVSGAKDAEMLRWTDTITYMKSYTNQTRYTETLRMVATRTNNVTPIATGRMTPKAARITPDVQSGILSTFAAYCERQYFTAQGQSNAWDEAQWGPTSGFKEFWFDPMDRGYEYSFHPTNRTISTRRLILYDAMTNAANDLLILSRNGFKLRAPARPGWIDGSIPSTTLCWWSSTDGEVFDVNSEVVPDFDWTRDINLVQGEWEKCSQTFQLLKPDAIWYPGTTNEEQSVDVPTAEMMKRVSFGQNDDHFIPTNFVPASVSTNVRGMIEANFTGVDGWAITNDARRLISDRLCCMNQMLGLLDRTYHVPEITYPSVATNFHFENSWLSDGVLNATIFSFDTSSGRYIVSMAEGQEHPLWDSGAYTNRLSAWGTDVTPGAYRMNTDSTYTEDVFNMDVDGEWSEADDVIALAAYGLVLGEDPSLVIADIKFDHVEEHEGRVRAVFLLTASVTNSTISRTGYAYGDFVLGTNITAHYSYERSYNHARTIGWVEPQVTQPGFHAYNHGRVAESTYGFVIGAHYQAYDNYYLEPLTWNRNYSTCEYKSETDTYNSRRELREAIYDFIDVGRSKYAEEYCVSPFAWEQIIPISITDATRCRDSVEVYGVEISLVSNQKFTRVTYKDVGGVVSVDHVATIDSQGNAIPGYHNLAASSLTYDYNKGTPEQEERAPLAMDLKLGIITRTDWNWKTLKRED